MPANGTARTNRGVTHSLLLLLGKTYEWGNDAHTLSISALTLRFRCRSLAAEDQRQGWQEKRYRAATRAGPLTVILVACTMHGGETLRPLQPPRPWVPVWTTRSRREISVHFLAASRTVTLCLQNTRRLSVTGAHLGLWPRVRPDRLVSDPVVVRIGGQL